MDTVDISKLTDIELHEHAERLAAEEREKVAELLEVLAVIDEKRLFEKHHCASLYEYCVCALRLSEAAAYRRIRAVRAIRLFPPVSVLLREGKLSLETTTLLHPFLESPEAAVLVHQASGMRTWQVARLLASRQAPPPTRDFIRFTAPAPPTSAVPLTLLESPPSAGLAPEQAVAPAQPPPAGPAAACKTPFSVRVTFTAGEGFWRDLEFARSLLRHKYPDGKLEGVLGDALRALLDKKDRGRAFKPPSRPPRKMAE